MACGSWYREIELQKAFGMSPNEARYYAWFDNGVPTARIAELCGVSVHTVGATLQRARDKVKKTRGKTLQFIIVKGNKDNEGTAIKQHSVAPVARFVADVLGARYDEGRHVISVSGVDAQAVGDLGWCRDNILRYVYWEGVSNSDDEDRRLAEKLKARYILAKGSDEKEYVGSSLLRWVLDDKYMAYDVFEEGGDDDGKKKE